MTEIFADAKVTPKRVVVIYSNDLFGQTQTRQFQAAVDALRPPFAIVETIAFPENTQDLSTEVSRVKAAKPDVIAPVVRATSGILLLQELAKQRVEAMGVISPGTPGFYEKGQIDQLKALIENVMDNVPWVIFNDLGDNLNASTAMIQIREQKPQVGWARGAAQTRYVFPVKK